MVCGIDKIFVGVERREGEGWKSVTEKRLLTLKARIFEYDPLYDVVLIDSDYQEGYSIDRNLYQKLRELVPNLQESEEILLKFHNGDSWRFFEIIRVLFADMDPVDFKEYLDTLVRLYEGSLIVYFYSWGSYICLVTKELE